ncbi:hypothetical protein A2814_01255 [Candidatus Nomurabacteria bacterium RIFCSPHIGHO2_01_FULL_38_19]|uniref:Uncharacterized protein n=1 Tax=Candidatus Nomurabacteria bacterium RIFCSPHIGHO2_01_FULL_38_19 TaxID=1801732 RepID=A0A1F6UQN4_9BACT|nr:MAG: hypothetical protein A2814_01255 [Candidatus Nomurabacteria bacterium RIFCSPHIGHO2_01_FULL_38_19]
MDWFLKRLQHTNPTLDYQDLFNHGDDFKKLLDLKIIKHWQTLENLPCEWCEEEHFISPLRNNKDEIVISCSGNRRAINQDELKVWTINKEILVENVKSKNPVIDKDAFGKTAFASKRNGDFYIRKYGNDFRYKGDLRILSKNNDWYQVFCALYDLIPDGGEIPYAKLGGQIKSKIKKTKNYNAKEMIKFIQTNLTDRSNGFMHYASIPENEDNSKPLLSVNRGKGIIFNNRIR